MENISKMSLWKRRKKSAYLCKTPDYINYDFAMKELILNGAEWKTQDDVYDSFFRAVGAPEWHGRNFNALRDSIATGSINTLKCHTGW
jgi:hypothetical protein